jgi:two-component system sensor histidine kinase KdpD
LPLSHIKGFVTSLLRTDIRWDEETRNEFIAEIDVETDRLAELVDSLLAARMLNGQITAAVNLETTSPTSAIQGSIHRVRGLFGDRSLRLDLAPSLPSIRMDARQIERMLANLLENAIKYSPPGTTIGVSARITDDCELEFSVEDEGPGIPLGARQRIFSPFFRDKTAQCSPAPGHGLGLAICQSIVLAHRGRILVTDRPGGGARFSVFLPADVDVGQFDDDAGRERCNDPARRSGRGRPGATARAAVQPLSPATAYTRQPVVRKRRSDQDAYARPATA